MHFAQVSIETLQWAPGCPTWWRLMIVAVTLVRKQKLHITQLFTNGDVTKHTRQRKANSPSGVNSRIASVPCVWFGRHDSARAPLSSRLACSREGWSIMFRSHQTSMREHYEVMWLHNKFFVSLMNPDEDHIVVKQLNTFGGSSYRLLSSVFF